MNYKKQYIKLIRKAQNDPILFDDTYVEKHHIFPKSLIETIKDGFNIGHISACCNKRYGRKTHKGFYWDWA